MLPCFVCNGHAEEAMHFYENALDGKIVFLKKEETGAIDYGIVDVAGELMCFSDKSHYHSDVSNTVEINLDVESKNEFENLFSSLSQFGQVLKCDYQNDGTMNRAVVVDQYKLLWAINFH